MTALQMQIGFHDFTNFVPDGAGQSSKAMQTKFVPSKNWTKNIVFFLSIICCKAITLSIFDVSKTIPNLSDSAERSQISQHWYQ